MDIRIGNDIRIDAKILDYVESNKYHIERVGCLLISNEDDDTPFPPLCVPNHYNVNPISKGEYKGTLPRFIGNSPNLTFQIEDVYLKELENHYWYEPKFTLDRQCGKLEIYFPGKHLKVFGTYKLMIFIVLYDESWKDPHIHTVIVSEDELFNLVKDIPVAERVIINCNICLNDQTVVDISNGKDGKDGENAISVLVFTEAGNILVDSNGMCKLIARIYDGRDDITDNIPSQYLSWTKTFSSGEPDVLWNNEHVKTGNIISIPYSQLKKQNLFECVFDLEKYFNNL